MKLHRRIAILSLAFLLAACQPATPFPPLTIAPDTEFTLAQAQSATIQGTHITFRLIGVSGDERCPSEIECAVSGPVSISLAAQEGAGASTDINLQTFTGSNGRIPDTFTKGIQDRAVFAGYEIRVTVVLPYPLNRTAKIKDSEYRVTLVVSKP